jgi:hypothetical protein
LQDVSHADSMMCACHWKILSRMVSFAIVWPIDVRERRFT